MLLFALFIYLLNKKITHGPYDHHDDEHSPRHMEMAGSFTAEHPTEATPAPRGKESESI
jgi:cytochrome d ubiquinol oxidase subunit I